jgi:hypothetical protein
VVGSVSSRQATVATPRPFPESRWSFHPNVGAAIAARRSEDLTFLVTEYGKPYTPARFGNAVRDWWTKRICECSLHDPPLGQNLKTDGGSRTFDNLDPPSTCSRGCFGGLRPSITAVTVDALDKGNQPTRAAVEDRRRVRCC